MSTKIITKMINRNYALGLILLISTIAAIGIGFVNPIAQNADYHRFADGRTVFAINNFWNVMSNIIFACAGVVGLTALTKAGYAVFPKELRIAYRVFFSGVLLVAVGSGYYHLAPDNIRLVWDRLPMTIAFMALFSIILGEYIALKLGRNLLLPLLMLGAAAVGYWYYSEQLGRGDLKFYLLVQFLPMLIIPIILTLFTPIVGRASGYWCLLGCYVLAKLCEHWDAAIYNLGWGLSGHTLKHVIAAVGVLMLALAYKKRNCSSSD